MDRCRCNHLRRAVIVPRAAYGWPYQRARRALLGRPCSLRLVCDGAPADSADHDPPLSMHRHVERSGCCRLRPACSACQHKQGALLAAGVDPRSRALPVPSRPW